MSTCQCIECQTLYGEREDPRTNSYPEPSPIAACYAGEKKAVGVYVEPRVWIIEDKSGVIITHYAAVAEKFALSPLHVVTPYHTKL